MGGQDITLKMQGGTFNYRIGAIIMDAGRILMARNIDSPYYYSVGGRAKFGEAARDAAVREAYEETQIRFEIDRLAFMHENFFVAEDGNEPYHEISLFFLMKHNDKAAQIKEYSFAEEYSMVTLHWLPIDGLGDLQLYPEFFKAELADLSDGSRDIKHFVTRDGVTLRVQ